MKRLAIVSAILVFVLLTLVSSRNNITSPAGQSVTINEITVPPIPTLALDNLALGESLYNQLCANCHGENLEGKPDWKERLADDSFPPPPHDGSGHTWHHPDSVLIDIVLNGGNPDITNTAMPGFGDRLSLKETEAILDYKKSHWGAEERAYQWWLTAQE